MVNFVRGKRGGVTFFVILANYTRYQLQVETNNLWELTRLDCLEYQINQNVLYIYHNGWNRSCICITILVIWRHLTKLAIWRHLTKLAIWRHLTKLAIWRDLTILEIWRHLTILEIWPHITILAISRCSSWMHILHRIFYEYCGGGGLTLIRT